MKFMFGYGRTRTHLSLILLSALAVLCIAIVSMCVFSNLNALATDNIAYAEEPTRANYGSYTFSNDNLIPTGDFTSNTFTIASSITLNSWCQTETPFTDFSFSSAGLSFKKSSTGYGYLLFCLDSTDLINVTLAIAIHSGATTSMRLADYNFTSANSYYTWSDTFLSRNDRVYYISITKGSGITGTCGFGFAFSGTSNNITLEFCKLEVGTAYTGLPSNSFSPNGYDIGYADGIASGGSSDPDYSSISSTGIVKDNLVNDNDGSVWDFNISLTQSDTNYSMFFQNMNFSIYANSSSSNSGTIINNHVNATSAINIWFDIVSLPEPVLQADTYTLTFGFSHLSGEGGYIAAYINGNVISSLPDYDSSTGSYISLTFDLSSYNSSQLNSFSFLVCVYGDTELDFDWIKLEQGESFSGYVPKSYSMYGYNNGHYFGRIDGYAEGYKAAELESFNFIGFLENMPFYEDYFQLGAKQLVSYAAEEDSYSYNNQTYSYQYYDTQGDDTGAVFNGLVLNYLFKYKVRIVTQLFIGHWDTLGFKFLIIDSSDHNSYFYVSREDTQFITHLATFIGTDFGDIYTVQFDIDLPDNNRSYYVAIVPINWDYHDINAQSRELRSSSYQDTSTFLIWDNTEFYGLTTQSNYADIVDDRVSESWSDGHYQGLIEGRAQGYQGGYGAGYNAGSEASGTYSFMSLIGAVFDAPISAVRGLLNFEILGVNLYDFVLALLSLAIILFVFRIFVRGL